jgi:hypothetical protein
LGITTTPKYRIKGVMHLGWVEYRAIVEIFHESKVISRHQGAAFRASNINVVADAT